MPTKDELIQKCLDESHFDTEYKRKFALTEFYNQVYEKVLAEKEKKLIGFNWIDLSGESKYNLTISPEQFKQIKKEIIQLLRG